MGVDAFSDIIQAQSMANVNINAKLINNGMVNRVFVSLDLGFLITSAPNALAMQHQVPPDLVACA